MDCEWRPRSSTYCFGTTRESERDRERERERRREYDEMNRRGRGESVKTNMTGDTQSAVTRDLSGDTRSYEDVVRGDKNKKR